MKKNLLGWLAMAAMLVGTGCSTDEVVNDFSQENAIQFGTYVGRNAVSRATVIDNIKLATDGFGVFAYYTDNADFVSEGEGASSPNFMYNQLVKVEDDETEYSYTPIKYWPNESTDKLSFFAYAPYSDGSDDENFTFNTNTGLPTIQFTVNGTVKEQEDLLWAAPHLNLVKNTTPGVGVNDKVKFEFKHALSRIGFEVQTMIDKKNGDDVSDDDTTNDEDYETKTEGEGNVSDNGENLAAETTVVVKKVELSGKFITNGTLAWSQVENSYTAAITGTSSTSDVTYTLEAAQQENGATNFKNATKSHSIGAIENSKVTVYGQFVNQTEAQLNDDDSYIMIIPKEFKDDDKLTIKVYYDVITTDANLTSGYSQVSNEISTSFSGVKFDAGKAYKFSLHLGLTSVKLEAEVADWDEENGKDWAVNLPLNIEDDDTPAGGTDSGDSNN